MDEATWTPDQLWKRALKHSKQVEVEAPEEIEVKDDTDTIAEREFIKRMVDKAVDRDVEKEMKRRKKEKVDKGVLRFLSSTFNSLDRLAGEGQPSEVTGFLGTNSTPRHGLAW